MNASSKYGYNRTHLNNFRSIEVKPRTSNLAYYNAISSKNSTKKRKLYSRKSKFDDYEARFNKLISQSALRRTKVRVSCPSKLSSNPCR
jgi:hypothetical protein